jgi:ethanolamine transporter
MRALEVAGYIGMMLAGALPMVYLIQKYLNKPMGSIGKVLGLGEEATTGLLGACANAIVLFPIIKDMKPADKVKTISFTVCGAYLIGDHLSFAATFHSDYIMSIFFGKLLSGVLSIVVAGVMFKLYSKKEAAAM